MVAQRNRAVIEIAICGIQDTALEHVSSRDFFANVAWFASKMLGHNQLRWSAPLGEITIAGTFVHLGDDVHEVHLDTCPTGICFRANHPMRNHANSPGQTSSSTLS